MYISGMFLCLYSLLFYFLCNLIGDFCDFLVFFVPLASFHAIDCRVSLRTSSCLLRFFHPFGIMFVFGIFYQ